MTNNNLIWIVAGILVILSTYQFSLVGGKLDIIIEQTTKEKSILTTGIYTEPKFGCQYIVLKENGVPTATVALLNAMGLPECPAFRRVLEGANR